MIRRIIIIAIVLFTSGCATTDFNIQLGQRLFDKIPATKDGRGTCVIHAKTYAWLIGGKVMSNGGHAFVVKDNTLYDSTNMRCTGIWIDDPQIIREYGIKESWKEYKGDKNGN